jgi:16S rRNA (guanine527-N7)-methyltransferase
VTENSDVSRETQQIRKYVSLLNRWNSSINLIGPISDADLETRHIQDGRFLASLLPSGRTRILDLGSGGGLPGIPIAIDRPDLAIGLVESDRRKASFLRAVRRELGLTYDVYGQRIETLPCQNADVVTARALAPLRRLLGYVARHLPKTGIAFLPKGERWRTELEDAKRIWAFEWAVHQTPNTSSSVILEITDLRQVPHEG